jgi:hypothetical protein
MFLVVKDKRKIILANERKSPIGRDGVLLVTNNWEVAIGVCNGRNGAPGYFRHPYRGLISFKVVWID